MNFKKLLVSLVIVSIMTLMPAYSSSSTVKTIGNEEVEFIIPNDYDSLKTSYLLLIDGYVQSENLCIRQQIILDKYSRTIDQLAIDNASIQKSADEYIKNSNVYIKQRNKFSIHLGGEIGASTSFKNNHLITFGPTIDFIKQSWAFGLFIPVTVGINSTDNIEKKFDSFVGFGMKFSRRMNN